MLKEVNLSVFAMLTAVCCLTHFATHLHAADFGLSWWLAAGLIVAACLVLQRVTMRRYLVLLGLQVAHVIVDAPFNPDHWLLQCFVNLAVLWSALMLWFRTGRVDDEQLTREFAPVARWLFLICYGFAALCKYNTHFLGEASCAAELARVQIEVTPWLGYLVRPRLAGWLTVLCETLVPVLLFSRHTRKYGVMLGLVFHTLLVLSPGIAVFDFTVTIYTMLYLFTPPEMGQRLARQATDFKTEAPAVAGLLSWARVPVLVLIGGYMIGRSAWGLSMYGSPAVGRFSWLINMLIAMVIIGQAAVAMFGRDAVAPKPGLDYRPRYFAHYLFISLAVLNGLSPYLGLKTQGSFTMFSNLRTEAGEWNHLFMPRAMRVVRRFQDNLIQVTETSNRRLQHDYVAKDYLVPAFEIRRAAARSPDMSITVIRDGRRRTIHPASLDTVFGRRPSWLLRKLFIFRPVTPDGSPYCGN